MVDDQFDCAAVYDRLDLYLDGELPHDELAALRTHVAACFPCADHASFGEQLKALVRDRCREQAPPALVARIRDHLASTAG
jgi:anti-sigma factor (TIGR02949 family)